MSLKDRLLKVLPSLTDCSTNIQGSFFYIKDMKAIDGGIAQIDCHSTDIAAVELCNPSSVTVDFYAFPDNALVINPGKYESQCECVLFPEGSDQEEWVLFIETKYADNLENAQRKESGYPIKMVNQIKKTVAYFRQKNIIAQEKKVHAIVSFPTLYEGFDAWTFPIKYDDGTTESVEDILHDYNIHIRATNYATIKNRKRIKLACR